LVEIGKIVEEEAMHKLLAPPKSLKQMTSAGVFEEGYGLGSKNACAPEPEA
jgi:hypothetical protein